MSDSGRPAQQPSSPDASGAVDDGVHAVRVTSTTLASSTAARPRDAESSVVTHSVQAAASWAWRFLAIAAALAVVFSLVAYLKVVIIPVAVALLLTVLLQPVSSFLRRRARFSPALAAATSVILLVAGIVLLVVVAGRSIVSGISDLSDQAVQGFQKALTWLADGPLHIDNEALNGYLDSGLAALEENSSALLSGALSVTTTVGQVLAGSVIALFCTLFFLMDGRRIWSWLVGLLPRSARERTHQAGRRGLVTLASYARTQILVAFIDSVGIGIGAAIIGVPLALPLGVLVFIGSFIPFVGAIVTGSMAVLVALVALGPWQALIMLGVVLLVQQIEGNVLQPWLMGHAVSLHPVAVLLVVTAGTLTAGIVGALFAVPVVAVLNTVFLYFHGHDKFPELGFDDHVDVRPAGRRAVMVMSAENMLAAGVPATTRTTTATETVTTTETTSGLASAPDLSKGDRDEH